MTSQKEFLQKLIKAIESAEIPYMLSGSIGSGFHGQPRATNDIDIVISPSRQQLLLFIVSLGTEYYVGKEAALEALENNSMFNVIDVRAGWKADFVVCKKRTYSQTEFSRRKNVNILGMNLYMLSPEDSVLSKLEWSKGRESQIQFKDALGVLTVQWDRLDFDYLKKWANELRVADLLEKLLIEVRRLKTQDNS